jgi:hypothetical protein
MSDPKALPRDWPPVLNRQLSEDHANTDIERIPALNRDSTKTFGNGTAEHLRNILDVSGIPLLVVGGDLKLLSFTSAVTAAARRNYPPLRGRGFSSRCPNGDGQPHADRPRYQRR